jgi:hypothetical protein
VRAVTAQLNEPRGGTWYPTSAVGYCRDCKLDAERHVQKTITQRVPYWIVLLRLPL